MHHEQRLLDDVSRLVFEWPYDDIPTPVLPQLYPSSAQPPHHRIFWREETTSASLWEGTRRAVEGGSTAGDKRKSCSSRKGGAVNQQRGTCSSPTSQEDEQKKRKKLSPADTIREISASSDLRRLARVFSSRRINTSCRRTFAAALRDANPAVVDMWLRHGKEHGGVSFLEAFRSWGEAGFVDGDRSPSSLPLHLSCHAGSPEVVSVRTGIDVGFTQTTIGALVKDCFSS